VGGRLSEIDEPAGGGTFPFINIVCKTA